MDSLREFIANSDGGNQLIAIHRYLQDQLTWKAIFVTASAVIPAYAFYKIVIENLLSPLRKIPGLPYGPIFGNMREFMRGEAMEESIKVAKEIGLVARYHFFFGGLRILVTDPEIFRHVFVTNSKNYQKPPSRLHLLRLVLGNGLVTSEGSLHAIHKKLMSPSFNKASVKKMTKTFIASTRKFVEVWKEKLKSGEEKEKKMPLQVDLQRLTLDIIGKAAFSYDFNSIDNSQHETTIAVGRILSGQVLTIQMSLPYYHRMPFPDNLRLKRDLNLVENAIDKVIMKKQEAIQANQDLEEITKDVLGIMMLAKDEETGEGMSPQQLRDQVITLMFAGHETTGISLTWCLHQLSLYPEVQEKARKEIQSVLQEDEDLTLETLEKLPYLNCVAKESLRLFPAVPMTLREAMGDDYFGDYLIPKGTICLMGIGAMMRLPQFYKDPETFNPDRFIDPESEESQSFYKYLPFLIGPRMCLGYKFALQEMKVILALLLKNFSFKPVEGVKYKRSTRITMRPQPEMELIVSLA